MNFFSSDQHHLHDFRCVNKLENKLLDRLQPAAVVSVESFFFIFAPFREHFKRKIYKHFAFPVTFCERFCCSLACRKLIVLVPNRFRDDLKSPYAMQCYLTFQGSYKCVLNPSLLFRLFDTKATAL